MNPYFAITPAVWNGKSERLGKQRSYHPTISVNDEPEREAMCSQQDGWVLKSLQWHRNPATASQIHKELMGDMLLSSIRRSLNTLMRKGLVRKVGTIPGPYKHPETTWTAA